MSILNIMVILFLIVLISCFNNLIFRLILLTIIFIYFFRETTLGRTSLESYARKKKVKSQRREIDRVSRIKKKNKYKYRYRYKYEYKINRRF